MKRTAKASSDPGLKFPKHRDVRKTFYTKEEYREMVLSESDLQSACEAYLVRSGWVKAGMIEKKANQIIKGVFVRVPNQAFVGNRNVKDCLANMPDITLLHPAGRYLGFELKAKKGEKSKGQKAIAKYMQIIEVRIFEDFVKLIEAWY